MKKKIITLLMALVVVSMYSFSGAASIFAADNSSSDVGKSVTCYYYIHYITNKSQIDFGKATISGQPGSNYTIGIKGTITVPAWTKIDGSNKYYYVDTKGSSLPASVLTGAPSLDHASIQKLFNDSKSKLNGKTVTVNSDVDNATWYVVKKHSDGYHVDGYVMASVKYSLYYDDNTTDSVTSMPTDSSSYAAGKTATLSTQQPVRTGYVFKGWAASRNSKTAVTSVTFGSGNQTVYAIWEPVATRYTIRANYYTNGVKDNDSEVTLVDAVGTSYGNAISASEDVISAGAKYEGNTYGFDADSNTTITAKVDPQDNVITLSYKRTISSSVTPPSTNNGGDNGTTTGGSTTGTGTTDQTTATGTAATTTTTTTTDNTTTAGGTTVTADNNETAAPVSVSGTSTATAENNSTSAASTASKTVSGSEAATAVNANSDIPKTGDTSDLIIWAVLGIAAMALAGAAMEMRRRKQ